MQAFKKGETGFIANCLPNILEQELQRNRFDGFFYPLNGLSIGVLLDSTQVRFRATIPQNIRMKQRDFFIVMLNSKQKNAPEIIYPGCSKFKTYSVFVCTGRVYDFDVFQIP